MRRTSNLLLTAALSIASGGCTNTVPEEVLEEPTTSGSSSSGSSTTGVESMETEDSVADESSASGSASASSTSTGDASDSSSTTDPEPVCGNGIPDIGEQCDDGNDDEFDECTTACTIPTCDDGIHDGEETDVDCGGPCDNGCAECLMCVVDEDCGEDNTCNESGQCTFTQLVQIDWLANCSDGPGNGVTLTELLAGDYEATALPSAGTLWLPETHNPPSSGYFWEAQSPQVTFTQMQTPAGVRYVDADTAFANMRATSEVFTHAGGDLMFYREDTTCGDNAGGLEFVLERCCEGAC
ncbi:MAG: DUF4215 domain-containing protein [Myxococcota bacterium]